MLRFDQLIDIFSELSPDNKELLYDFLINEFSKRNDEESKNFVELLKDGKEDLMDYDEEVNNYEKKPLYFTQDEIAIMIGKSKRQVQRIIKDLGIKPINPNRKPAYYDLESFKDLYIPHMKAEKDGKYIDYSIGIPVENELPVLGEKIISTVSPEEEIQDENDLYNEAFFDIFEENRRSNKLRQKGGLFYGKNHTFKYTVNFG